MQLTLSYKQQIEKKYPNRTAYKSFIAVLFYV